jgi:hypothetical protein
VSETQLALLPGLDGTGLLFRPLLEALPVAIRPTVIACARWFEQRFKQCVVHDVDGPHFLLRARPRESAALIAHAAAA